jgi:hypothetical protein
MRASVLLSIMSCVCWTVVGSVAQEAKSEAPAAAPAAPELSLTILPPAAVVRAGDLIPIEFIIENKGTTDYVYDDRDFDRSGRMEEYALAASDEQGNAVPDPRRERPRISGGWIGKGTLAPEESITKSIPLNRWALINKPGRYVVTGTYHRKDKGSVVSKPITVTVEPRTDEEMAAYIASLGKELAAVQKDDSPDRVLEKLVYTCDARIVPTILEAMYQRRGNASFWGGEALTENYLPQSKEITDMLIKSASERGMAQNMFWILKQRGAPDSQVKPLIEVSLSPEHPECWAEGALGHKKSAMIVSRTGLLPLH